MKTSNWTAREIEEHQDELADHFESIDPAQLEQIPVAEGYLRWAVKDAAAAPSSVSQRRELDDAAARALREGSSPEKVAQIMGVAVEEVLHRYIPAS